MEYTCASIMLYMIPCPSLTVHDGCCILLELLKSHTNNTSGDRSDLYHVHVVITNNIHCNRKYCTFTATSTPVYILISTGAQGLQAQIIGGVSSVRTKLSSFKSFCTETFVTVPSCQSTVWPLFITSNSVSFIHSFRSLSYDKSEDSSKASSPQSPI
jgi:hypothetical protein